ncbi:hypothetical protein [uncultured Clostridium sp.]|uniref:hypothetical protein n=1 Tax=uncultured Clostridium sp. TaxID=59620 RepID=UPI00258D789F|nr:hypothetical protein [uncultured Clostridium sp.]
MLENNINIEGIGSIREGQYEAITIDGVGTIQGDISVKRIEVNGKSKALGKISCNKMDVNGYCKTKGIIKGKFLEVNGRVNSEKEVSFDNIKVSGELFVNGNCQCEDLYLDGRMKISGLLSGDNLDLNISKVNEIKEIGGEKVSVKKNKTIYKLLFFSKERNAKLICDEIEADEIYLENTYCNIVRGRNITIGDGCVLNKIEYTGEINITGKSEIKEKVYL